jgi:phytoene dehydrogenase-like protein
MRPALGVGGYRTPIDRLYLSGAGTHPGGGVSATPGRLAAQQVLRNISRGARHHRGWTTRAASRRAAN